MARPFQARGLNTTRLREEALATADTQASDSSADVHTADHGLEFPSLEGPDERRMEDLLAVRLFPREAAALRIGRYTLLDRLGQGGMGVVYAAYDPELDRRVAIKLLSAWLGGRAEERLIREAQAMARVVHANVVSVIEVGRDRGQTFVVMEHLRGISLDRWAERRPGWREVVRVYVQAGRGLAAAHRAGVIHRDFKPSNVMIVEGGVDDGRVKVLDFGLARAAVPVAPAALEDPITGSLARSMTRTGTIMGTPAYMAPEQLEGAQADERSDQFSFAVSLYEALYGQLPFPVGSLRELSTALQSGEVRPPPPTDVPAWVQRVVLRGLARAPDDRHPSMTAMCDALERDPAARRRAIGLSLALSAVVGAGGWGLAQLGGSAASPCSGPAFALADVWNDARVAEVERAFAATELPFAADTARRVRPILDEYAGAWSSARTEACEAHQRGEQSAQLLDLRMACLDRRRAGFASLTELLARADGTAVERAVEAALQLPSLAGCADAEALLAETSLPDDPERAGAVEAARRRLAELDALAGAGRFDEAAAAAEVALAEAERLEFMPLVAEAALALGSFELERRRGEQAERALSLAVRAGIEGRADRAVAEALSRRLFVHGALLGQHERALADEELVAAHTARFPSDGALQWLTANNRGAVAHFARDHGRARELYERALAVTDSPSPLDLARTRVNLGLLAADVRDFEAALASYRAAIAQASSTLGAAHPLVSQLGVYEASALAELGRRGAERARLEALIDHPERVMSSSDVWPLLHLSLLDIHHRQFEAARARASQALALTDPSDVYSLINVEAALASAVSSPEEAQAHYDSALRRARAAYGETHTLMAWALRHICEDMLRRGRPRDALPLLREALTVSEQVDGAGSSSTAAIRRLLSDALLALGELDEALESAKSAVATFVALPGDRTRDLARSHHSLGRAHLARGEASSAAQALRAALELFESRLDADDPELAATRVDLARALLALDASDAEAQVQLGRAREAYTSLGEPFAPELAEIGQLLVAPGQ